MKTSKNKIDKSQIVELPLSLNLKSFKLITEDYSPDKKLKKFKEINDYYNSINIIYAPFYKNI